MTIRKNILFILVTIVVILGGAIVFYWFCLFGSNEYYKGFDWNTNKNRLEWRLSKDHYWYNDEEYKSNARELEENRTIRFEDSFFLDKKTQKLKEIRLDYLSDDTAKLEEIYNAEVEKLKKKLGKGTDCESKYALYTEWRGEYSVIRVVKWDLALDDSISYVEVIYQDKRESKLPYFTETHIGQDVYEKMLERFHCISTPEYNEMSVNASKDPDFSDYKLYSTDETKKVVALMNKHLFIENDGGETIAGRIASSRGITKEHPMTVDWVMDHPAKSVAILTELTREDDFLKSRSDVDKAYERLTDEEKRKS